MLPADFYLKQTRLGSSSRTAAMPTTTISTTTTTANTGNGKTSSSPSTILTSTKRRHGVVIDSNASNAVVAPSPIKNAIGERLRSSNATPVVKLLAGMAGGVAEATMLQPLDVAKTRLQLDRTNQYRGMFDCLKKVATEEGPKALYKGLTPFVTHLTFKYALRFGLFEQLKLLLNRGDPGKASRQTNFLAGLAVGCIEATLIVTPFEVVKTRLQQQRGTKNLKYSGPIDVVVKVIKEEGIRRMWSGNMPTVIRQGSNQAFNFMSMALLNEKLWDKRPNDGKTLEIWKTLLNGLLAGAVGPCFNSPVDVVKSRMMAQSYMPGETIKYTGWFQAATLIAKEEGLPALWKGLVPRLTRLAPGQAITWTVVMRVTAFFENARIEAEKEALEDGRASRDDVSEGALKAKGIIPKDKNDK